MLSIDDVLCGDYMANSHDAARPGRDVIFRGRVRLVRNFAAWPFMTRMTDGDRVAMQLYAVSLLNAVCQNNLTLFDFSKCDSIERRMLAESQLIRDEFALSDIGAVAICDDESLSVVIGDEDHLQLQVATQISGLRDALKTVLMLNQRLLDEGGIFAISEEFGYLAASPTNVGSGMRAELTLHLPGLRWTNQIDRAARALHQIQLSFREAFPNSHQASGDLFHVNSFVSLGMTETELLDQLESVIPDILTYERSAREYLRKEKNDQMREQLGRAIRMLSDADAPDLTETLEALSILRYGIVMGMVPKMTLSVVDRLFLLVQPAHIQNLVGSELEPADCAIERARILRENLIP